MKNQNKFKSLNIFILLAIMGISFLGANNVNAQCQASFTYVNIGNGYISFTNTSTGSGAPYYSWSFGDGNYSNSVNPNNTYLANGNYEVCLTVVDSNMVGGCTSIFCDSIQITNSVPCNITSSFTYVDNGLGNYSFTSTSVGGNYYVWDFGDGTTVTTNNLSQNHTYFTNGNYNVCLTTLDSNNACSDIICDTVIVTNAVNTPCNISASFTFVDNGLGNYSFTNTSTGSNQMYHWSFGDGNTSTASNPNHTYLANGTFVVALLSYSNVDTNCYDYYMTTVTVNNVQSPVPCNAAFVIYPDSNTNNVIVYNTTTGNNLSYFWEFGDGNTSTLQYPSYTYTTPGPFEICLTVVDSGMIMCTSTYCDSISAGGIVWKQSGFTINVTPVNATGIETELELISEINAYPNPVKNNLTIELNLLEQANVEVFVTDLLGKQVSVISNDEMQAGINKLQWNPSNILNGIYLLNIKTNNSLQVKKLVLNK
jgi:PKD repeat protein